MADRAQQAYGFTDVLDMLLDVHAVYASGLV